MSGPEGCGKNLLARHSTNRLQDEFDLTFNVAVLHCNARTSSKDVLQELRQFCSITTGTTGRIYRPEEGRRLVFYMKDINLPSPDKYGTSEIVMFLSQVVMHNGFYDDDLEFVHLEHVQIVSSMAPASTLERHPLATRVTANLRVWVISYPSRNNLSNTARVSVSEKSILLDMPERDQWQFFHSRSNTNPIPPQLRKFAHRFLMGSVLFSVLCFGQICDRGCLHFGRPTVVIIGSIDPMDQLSITFVTLAAWTFRISSC